MVEVDGRGSGDADVDANAGASNADVAREVAARLRTIAVPVVSTGFLKVCGFIGGFETALSLSLAGGRGR